MCLKALYNGLIVWHLIPFTTVCQLYCSGQCTYPCFQTISFPSHRLLSHITIVKPIDNSERGMNSVAILFSSLQCYWLSYRPWNCIMGGCFLDISRGNDNVRWRYFDLWKSLHHVNLTLCHTIPTFNKPEEEAFLKTFSEKEKMLVTNIFSFSQNVFYPSQNKFQYLINIFCCLQMLSIWTSLVFCRLVKSQGVLAAS